MRLKHFPDKPWEQDPKYLDEWDRSGNYVCQQKIDGWRCVVILTDDGIEYLSRHDKSLNRDIEDAIQKEAKGLRKLFPAQTQLDAEWLSRRSCSKEYNLQPKLFLLDLLRLGETWLLATPHQERQALLKKKMADFKSNLITLPLAAEPGSFVRFYEEQKRIPFSEGVVIKHKDSKIVGDRKECAKNQLWFKIKYRAGADGNQRLDHLRR